MKVTREQAAQNRDRVVATAARLFRERGFDGIGISDLMKEVGLTHGGFYAQFPSKEHLMAEAVAKAADERKAAMKNSFRTRLKRGSPALRRDICRVVTATTPAKDATWQPLGSMWPVTDLWSATHLPQASELLSRFLRKPRRPARRRSGEIRRLPTTR